MKLLKKSLLYLFVLLLMGACGGIAAIFYFSQDLPSVEQIANREIAQSTKIYDRSGLVLLYEVSNGTKRTILPFDQIPPYLKDATIAIEDEKFYEEPGFDWRGIVRAVWVDIRTGKFTQGASTITQQLARNAFLTTEKSISRKIKEFLLAIELNRQYSKDQILGFYLNEIPYGPVSYGVEAASETYFGKPAKDLSLAEAALLAALPKGPTYYSPWGSHTKELLKRQRLVLDKMLALGKIRKQEYDQALKEKFSFVQQGYGIKAPHFVMAVQDYLVQKYGEDMVEKGGLRVVTTLDWNLQQIAEKAVKDGADQNQQLYSGYNAALVAEDPKTGQLLAMVGSRDYFASSSLPAGCAPGATCKFEPNFNVATQGLRQPGSALKPFVYLTAFQMGYAPSTVLFDVPTEFAANNPQCPPTPDFTNDNKSCFHPQNFDDIFRGPISMKSALAGSVNIPAVKTLYLVGLDNAVKNANKFGLSTLTNPEFYGLSLVLGGGAVKLEDLVGAYSVLAQDGTKHQQAMILEVRDASNNVLESFKDKSDVVSDPQPVRLINNILSDPSARAALFQNSLSLTVYPGYDVALKTGTSNDYHDAWAMGYTPTIVAGVWAGNNDNTAMQRHGSSILAAVPIWHAFMTEALKTQTAETFTKPDPEAPQKPILAGNYLDQNQLHTILYSVDRKNPAGPAPAYPANDPQFTNWETGVLQWASKNMPNFRSLNQSSTPSSTSAISAPAPKVTIDLPTPGSFIQNQIDITAHISAAAPIGKLRVYFNNALVQEFTGSFGPTYAFSWSFIPQNPQPQNLLEIEAVDQNNTSAKSGVIVYSQSN